MSWWVGLSKEKDGEPIEVPPFEYGGTYAVGGSNEADVSITYNYSKFYYQAIDENEGIRWLDGKRASECIERLEKAVAELGTVRDSDYWQATSGNAGFALALLLFWARSNPDAYFFVH